MVYEKLIRVPPLPEGLIQVNGRIEGDTMEQGQILVWQADAETRTKVAQARYAVTAMEARSRGSRTSLDVLRKEIPLGVEEAKLETEQGCGEAEAVELQAHRDAKHYQTLAKKSTVSKRLQEQTTTAWTRACEELMTAITGQTLAEHQLDHARAALEEIQALLDDLKKYCAPTSRMITTCLAGTGEVVGAGFLQFDTVDLDHWTSRPMCRNGDLASKRSRMGHRGKSRHKAPIAGAQSSRAARTCAERYFRGPVGCLAGHG